MYFYLRQLTAPPATEIDKRFICLLQGTPGANGENGQSGIEGTEVGINDNTSLLFRRAAFDCNKLNFFQRYERRIMLQDLLKNYLGFSAISKRFFFCFKTLKLGHDHNFISTFE